MANHQRLYFYSPSWDIPPDGPIKLGNVITSVKRPNRPLFPTSLQNRPLFQTEKRSVRYTEEKQKRGQFSVLSRFVDFLGRALGLGAVVNRTDGYSFSFDVLETTEFTLDEAYIHSCLQSNNVRQFLEAARYRKPVYIITGIKVARGAKMHTAQSQAFGAKVPLANVVDLQGTTRTNAETVWDESSDFVFAFRVSKITVRDDSGHSASEEDYRKGAMLDQEPQKGEEPDLKIWRVEQPDAEAEGFDLKELVEDAELVLVAIPRSKAN